jgi:serine/threonine protein kinase
MDDQVEQNSSPDGVNRPDVRPDLIPGENSASPPSTWPGCRNIRGFSAVVDTLRQQYGWKLNEEIGRGGFAVVYREEVDGIPRAVKINLDPVDGDGTVAARQLEAVQLLLRLGGHPHLLTLIAYELVLGHLVTIWELAEEGTLADRLRAYQQAGQQGLPLDELLSYLEQAAEGIDFLNTRGIYHRDIKPHNLFLVGGQVKVGDLGLLKLAGLSVVSHSGAGTFGYTPPEAFAQPRQLHPTIDVYGLAATYVHLRTGRPPFGDDPHEIAQRQQRGDFHAEGLLPCEHDWLRLALSPNPEARPASAGAFVRELVARLSVAPVVELVPENDFPGESDISLPAVSRDYAPDADLPNLPEKLARLQKQYLAISEAILQVRRGTHPQLRTCLERLQQAEAHADSLRQEVENAPLPAGITPRIRDVIWNRLLHNPDQAPSALLKVLPDGEPTWERMQWLARVKQAASAFRPVAEARRRLHETRRQLLTRLRCLQSRMWEKLSAAQLRDLQWLLSRLRKERGLQTPQLPVELWAELGPSLQRRYLGWESRQLLMLAEWAWQRPIRWVNLGWSAILAPVVAALLGAACGAARSAFLGPFTGSTTTDAIVGALFGVLLAILFVFYIISGTSTWPGHISPHNTPGPKMRRLARSKFNEPT